MEEDQFSIGAKIVCHDFYIDDLITGANSMEEASVIRAQIMALFKRRFRTQKVLQIAKNY